MFGGIQVYVCTPIDTIQNKPRINRTPIDKRSARQTTPSIVPKRHHVQSITHLFLTIRKSTDQNTLIFYALLTFAARNSYKLLGRVIASNTPVSVVESKHFAIFVMSRMRHTYGKCLAFVLHRNLKNFTNKEGQQHSTTCIGMCLRQRTIQAWGIAWFVSFGFCQSLYAAS